MRRPAALLAALLTTLAISVVLPAGALAKHSPSTTSVAPPGNSAVSQYQEDVPTAGGSRPSRQLQPSTNSTPGGPGGSGPGSSGPSGTGTPGGGSPPAAGAPGSTISLATAHKLAKLGKTGARAASLAAATAPQSAAAAPSNHASSGALTGAFTGSGSKGLGVLLPVLLIGSLLLASGLGVVRIRRAT